MLSKSFNSGCHHTALTAILCALLLLLLYPVQPSYCTSKLVYFVCSLTRMEVTGILSSEVLSDKEDTIRILVTVTWQTSRWNCRRNNTWMEELHGADAEVESIVQG